MAAKGGLGTGLSALFDDNTTDTISSMTVRLSEIEPNRISQERFSMKNQLQVLRNQ